MIHNKLFLNSVYLGEFWCERGTLLIVVKFLWGDTPIEDPRINLMALSVDCFDSFLSHTSTAYHLTHSSDFKNCQVHVQGSYDSYMYHIPTEETGMERGVNRLPMSSGIFNKNITEY